MTLDDDQKTLHNDDMSHVLHIVKVIQPCGWVRHRVIFTSFDVAKRAKRLFATFYQNFLSNRPHVLALDTLWSRHLDRLYHCGKSVNVQRMLIFAVNCDRAFSEASLYNVHELLGEQQYTDSFWKRFWRSNAKYHATRYRIRNFEEIDGLGD